MSEIFQRYSNTILSDQGISIKTTNSVLVVARSQVRWVEAAGDYVRLHTSTHSYLARIPLSALVQCWGKYGFVRIHRSWVVYLPLVTKLWAAPSGYNVRIGSGVNAVDLAVSRRWLKQLRQQWIDTTLTDDTT